MFGRFLNARSENSTNIGYSSLNSDAVRTFYACPCLTYRNRAYTSHHSKASGTFSSPRSRTSNNMLSRCDASNPYPAFHHNPSTH